MELRGSGWLAVCLLLWAAACEGDGEESKSAGAQAADAASGADIAAEPAAAAQDAADGEGGGAPDTAPVPGLGEESQVSGSPDDDLFPDVDGDLAAFMRIVFKPDEVPEEGGDTDCVKCIAYAYSCAWCAVRIMRYDAADDDLSVLAEETYAYSSPRVAAGKVYWLRQGNELVLHDLDGGNQTTVHFTNSEFYGDYWLNAAPVLHDGRFYWQGYDYWSGQSGLMSANLDGTDMDIAIGTSFYEPYFDSGSPAAGLARMQPFSIAGGYVVWARWEEESVGVRIADLESGSQEVLAQDKDWCYLSPVASGSVVAWKGKAYKPEQGCYGAEGDMAVFALPDEGEVTKLTGDEAAVSRYAPLAVSGSMVFWLDYRDVHYAVYARDAADPDSAEVRVTSSEAVLGAFAAPAVSGDRMFWMDRRSGNWDIYGMEMP